MNLDENEPFSKHVYIGFCPKDNEIVSVLAEKLRNNSVSCYLAPIDVDRESSIRVVDISAKCLMFLSSDYLHDKWYEKEKTAMLRKVEHYGNDTLIIVKNKKGQKVPKEFQEFKDFALVKEQLDDENVLAKLVKEIKRGL